LISHLRALPVPCIIGFEATGNYHRTLGHRLVAEGFETCFISSVASARYREVMFNSWDKNDPKDAAVLLELLKQGITQRYIDPLIAGHHDLQEISKTYYQVTLSRTRLQYSLLTHYLPLYFPEMGKWWNSTRTAWWINYLLRFPVPSAITKYTQDEFCQIASPVVGRKVNKAAKLIELYETAQHSIGLPVAEDSLACKTFQVQLRRYQEINDCRMQLEATAQTVLANNPDSAILQRVPGIGPINALTILAEGGDLRRFDHHRQFLKYCGFDLAKNHSGNYRGQEQISKRGNARLRLALWMAVNAAIGQSENSFQQKYSRYIQSAPKDKDLQRKARTAVAAKMARVVYGLVKSQKMYQSYYEKALPSGSIPLCGAVEAARTS
jgi:transposase